MANLDRELATFKKELPNLLANEGKYAVVHDDEVAGVYESYADALAIAYDKFGLDNFLVKKISAQEQVSYFSRDIKTNAKH